ncbi:MAG: TIGR04283 family arsenosugar biosynthesis glycosyltransferase [Verrucomicrobiota bacterium]
MISLSVIIPTLNEAEKLSETLACFQKLESTELVVVDGGSADETVLIAETEGVRVLSTSEPGRARQMNLGASETSGDVLLFLHGDTQVPKASLEHLQKALEADRELLGGGFARRFDSSSLLLRFTSWCADFRGRWWGLFLGDQGIYVRRSAFEKLGGFDAAVYPGEDLDFSYRLSRLGKTRLISPPVMSSARRFLKEGAWKQTRLDFSAAREILAGAKRRARS